MLWNYCIVFIFIQLRNMWSKEVKWGKAPIWSLSRGSEQSKCLLLLRRLLRCGQLPSDCQKVRMSGREVRPPWWHILWMGIDESQSTMSTSQDQWLSEMRGGPTWARVQGPPTAQLAQKGWHPGADLEFLPWGATCPACSCWWPWVPWWPWGPQGPPWVHHQGV